MIPKIYLEERWRGDQEEDVLFISTYFKDNKDKIGTIEAAAKATKQFNSAETLDHEVCSDVLTARMYEYLANAKLLLFDISIDPRYKTTNPNVMYELGIARMIRNREDILVICEKADELKKKQTGNECSKSKTCLEFKLPFDITGFRYNPYPGKLNENWLSGLILKSLKLKRNASDKLIEATAKSLDDISLKLMHIYGKFPKDENNFIIDEKGILARELMVSSSELRVSMMRLIDLGIIKFKTVVKEKGRIVEHEYSYRWTNFGEKIMDYLGIKKIPLEEYKKTKRYKKQHPDSM